MTISETKNGKAKLFGRLAALSLAVWTLGGCDPEPVDTTPKAVLNLEAADGVNRVDLSWELASDENRTGIRVSYDHDNDSSTPDIEKTLGRDAKTYNTADEGTLAGGVAVKFSVRALGADGKTSKAAEKEGTPVKNTQEIATERKAEFDAWADSPDRMSNCDFPAIPALNYKDRALNDRTYNTKEEEANMREWIKNKYPLESFYTDTVQDAIDQEAALRPEYITKAPKAKQGANVQYIASVNKLNQQIVRNSYTHTV